MKKITLQEILNLIDGDPMVVYLNGWGEEDIVYVDLLDFDEEAYDLLIDRYGDYEVRCISTANLNGVEKFECIYVAFLI